VLVSLTAQGGMFLDRFQELGKETLRELLSQLTADEVETVAQAMNVLIGAAERVIERDNL